MESKRVWLRAMEGRWHLERDTPRRRAAMSISIKHAGGIKIIAFKKNVNTFRKVWEKSSHGAGSIRKAPPSQRVIDGGHISQILIFCCSEQGISLVGSVIGGERWCMRGRGVKACVRESLRDQWLVAGKDTKNVAMVEKIVSSGIGDERRGHNMMPESWLEGVPCKYPDKHDMKHTEVAKRGNLGVPWVAPDIFNI